MQARLTLMPFDRFLRKHSFFANLKKCQFHKDKVRFLGYVLSAQKIQIEDERIEAVSNWLEPKSMGNIQVFLGFANFYQCFIQGFNKIAKPLTLIFRTSSTTWSTKNLSLLADVIENAEVDVGGSDCIDKTVERSSSKNLNGVGYLTSDARVAFT